MSAPTGPMADLESLAQRVSLCTRCDLCRTRTRAVPGEGAPGADVLFIGEGPGFHEDRQGRPFVGPAGQYLDELLASVALRRADVYITNMVKCRPPNNRDPLPGEIQACGAYLDRQMELISPRAVVTLGRYSFSRFFPGEPISRARGKERSWNSITVYPMYHPAAALHNPSLRAPIEADFRRLPSLLARPSPGPQPSPPEQPQQLSLFTEPK